nr:LamG domain-containing protein [Kiritimatiellia bacterium]
NTYWHPVSQIRDLSSPLTIGALNPGYGVTYDGWLDDIQIHRSALAASTIADIYSAGAEVGPGSIAYYDFENGSDLGEDASDNGAIHDGTVYGSISQDGDSMVGVSSIRMHGNQNEYIVVSDMHSQLDATDELTIAFWAKPTSTGVDNNPRAVVSKRAEYQKNVSYSMFLRAGGQLRVQLDDGSDVPHTIDTGYTFQTSWQHVALVFDGNAASSSRVKLYVDGALEGTYHHGTNQIRGLSAPLTIGSLNPGYPYSFDGWLDDVRIFRRALSSTEVEGLNGILPSGNWNFDDGSGSTAMDLSGNGLNISLQGTYSWMSGQLGGALDLGGQSNSYGTVTDPDQLENTDKLTILFWVRPDNLDGNPRFVASKRDGYTVNNAFSAYFAAENRLYVEIDNNNSNNANKYTSASQFSNGTWYHVAVVYDGTLSESQRLKVYIDGDLDGNSPKSITSSSIPNYSSDFYLGIANSGYATTFGGRIDEFLIYRVALSEAEVEGLGGF